MKYKILVENDSLIINDDCIKAMQDLIDQDIRVDSIVTDPPYELGFMGKEWDKSGIAYNKELWGLCLKLLKPGGHLLAFGGARTYHRMACALEEAGFEIRDQIMWIYGSGFPKSLNVSKAIDKQMGEERPRNIIPMKRSKLHGDRPWMNDLEHRFQSNEPLSNAAKQWQGWGTALKPAHEPIVLARKPITEATIAANVLKHGTGAINIDGCRVKGDIPSSFPIRRTPNEGHIYQVGFHSSEIETAVASPLGRFPANLIHDGSEEVESEFAAYGESKSTACVRRNRLEMGVREQENNTIGHDDIRGGFNAKGTASRFYYCAKAPKKERNGSKHPTVKPIALMRYLCRLITPPGGIVLDPFAGTGTTGQAAIEEGFKPILIEKDKEYIKDIEKRLGITSDFCYDRFRDNK